MRCLSRPATHREDRAIVLTELAQGVYGAEIKLAPGLVGAFVGLRRRGASDPSIG